MTQSKLKIKYFYDENYNILSVGVFPQDRNASQVEIANALTSALVVELSKSLSIPQKDIAQAIVSAVKSLIPERE